MLGDVILIASRFILRFVFVTEITYLGPMPVERDVRLLAPAESA